VEEIQALIVRATGARTALADKHRAFGEIVKRFQDMAYACAYAVLGDFHLAEDAAQEAFIVAWRNLNQLHTPEAFPGWFKRIVLSQCSRLTRSKQLETVPLDSLWGLPSEEWEPFAQVAQEEFKQRVALAVQALPEKERMVTTLFYINAYSQNEIAAFLEVPVTTVKKRLYTARKQLRETMLDLVRTTLREQRPSKDEEFANTVALYNAALESFLGKVKQDRQIIAVILCGSLAYDKVWEKSDIDILLVGRDEKRPGKEFCLIENGINIHASLQPRSKFKQALERSLQGSFMHSVFSKSTLLYTTDETIRDYYADAQKVGGHDKEMQLLRNADGALYTLAKAEKWFTLKQDVTYSFLWIMYTINKLAAIEVTLHEEVATREVIHQALKHNPEFFTALYYDLIHGKKDEATIGNALRRINGYLDEHIYTLFRPVLAYLAEAGGIRSTTEIDSYFKKQAQLSTLGGVYEWLADKGILQKVPSPVRLTEKSLVEVDEAAYYYDGGSLK
jgi:RNA polymerase sigma factor (sigma-70 family)